MSTVNSLQTKKLPEYFYKNLTADDSKFSHQGVSLFTIPKYDPHRHFLDLTESPYYRALVVLRHHIKAASDYYLGSYLNAKNIDLFMLTPSVSSPMVPGSNSEPIPIVFGSLHTNLVDSSQFGFEPLLLNDFDKVYCYLPSMRGETPDKRHLNQFFHCESEIKGSLQILIPLIEEYIKILAETLLSMPNILERISKNIERTHSSLLDITIAKDFPSISFDDAVKILTENGYKNLVNFTNTGRDISAEGELKLAEILGFTVPFWITHYDRDRVPFYQKPDPKNPNKAINADLIFPAIIQGAFGGEVVGSGQRQDNVQELLQSLSRQNVSPEPYKWYIELRKLPNYKTTSGFGIGIERFITWALCRDDIKEAILYPRLKGVLTYP